MPAGCRLLLSRAGLSTLVVCVLLGSATASAQEIADVTIETPFPAGRRPTSASFFYNGRAIGSGRDAFLTILDRVRQLPAGTSIVWGPDYSRAGSRSGIEPLCLPKHLYPDLWKELETLVAERELYLSSTYPGPHQRLSRSDPKYELPAVLATGEHAEGEQFDATLDWEVGKSARVHPDDPFERRVGRGQWYRFLSAGEELKDFELQVLLGRLPEASRVLIRIRLRDEEDPATGRDQVLSLARNLASAWRNYVSDPIRLGNLKVAITAPPHLAEVLRAVVNDPSFVVRWSKYHGPSTLPDEVLCLVNDEFVGRGDPGFDRVLARLRALPEGSKVVLPRYEILGRWAMETYSPKQIRTMNAEFLDLVPFPTRRAEWDAAVQKLRLDLNFGHAHPGTVSESVLDWNSGNRDGSSFVEFGRIVQHDSQPHPAAARLGWTGYETGEGRAANSGSKRQSEKVAVYTIDDFEMGRGVDGFARAMDRLATLSLGSVVHVRVCVRTKGPFICPLIYHGQRHFERTGFEPYFGMFPWLIDVARKHNLKIE